MTACKPLCFRDYGESTAAAATKRVMWFIDRIVRYKCNYEIMYCRAKADNRKL